MTYIPHDWWCICQRTGMKFRRSEMREEWTGLWVHESVWNPRHPQDFVESIDDDPSVSPSFPDVEQTVGETTVYSDISAWVFSVQIVSIASLSDGDPIGIVMDNSACHWSFINGTPVAGVGYGTVILGSEIPYQAAAGNAVYLPSINSEDWQ